MMAIENNRLIMKQYVDDYVVFSDYMRRTEHDWRHFINALTEILNAGDIDRARLMLQSLSKANEANIMKEYCTDSLINAILNDTAKRSDTQGIDFSCTVRLGEEAVHIADIELTALMMNLLNNALENCDCPSCGSKKYINAELFTSSGYFIMRCENTIVSPPVMAGDRLITTKPDDGSPHGIGLESVRFIVNKHDGTMSIDVTDTVFKIRVMLKNKGP